MTIVPASAQNIALAAQALREGRLVAFPTETVYGLGADATDGEAVARVFEVKGRPRFNPLIVHTSSMDEAQRHGQFSMAALELARAFWPGALTLVVRRTRRSPVADLVSAGLDTLALRVPDHPVAQALLQQAALPVAAPSANASGHVSATSAAHVENDLGNGPTYILDGGPTPLGIESTVLDMSGDEPAILRAGAVARGDIEKLLGHALRQACDPDRPSSPGQLESHYAPHALLRLNAISPREAEAFLAFGPDAPRGDGPAINLSERGNLREAAANLFSALRKLDESGAMTIGVMPIPEEGLGEAINDRLRRAAAPRES